MLLAGRLQGLVDQWHTSWDKHQLLRKVLSSESEFRLFDPSSDKAAYIKSMMKICFTNGKDECYKNVSDLLFDQFGLKETLRIFAENEKAPEIYSRCHEVTHFLSRRDYGIEKSVKKVFDKCDFTCHGGCYHGAMEAYLKEESKNDNGDYEATFRRVVPTLCGKKGDYAVPRTFDECVHGVGHGAMFVTDEDVPQSLKLCDILDAQQDREGCWSGVFHENSSSSTNTSHPGKYTKKDDPMYPCDALDERYLHLCYRYQSSYFLFTVANFDWKETANWCSKVPEKYHYDCYLYMGTNQVGFTQDQNAWIEHCGYIDTAEHRNACIGGVVTSLAARFVGQGEMIVHFCEQVNDENRKSCFAAMGYNIGGWDNGGASKEKICATISNPQYAAWCNGRLQ